MIPIDDSIVQWFKDHSFLSGWIAVGLIVGAGCCRLIARPLLKRVCRRPLNAIKATWQHLVKRYDIWRTQPLVKRWFDCYQLNGVRITDYHGALNPHRDSIRNIRTFSVMTDLMKQPRLAPKLSDHLIATTIEHLANKGNVVKLSEPQIGGSYSLVGYAPNQATTYTIAKNIIPSEAGRREQQWEEERCCIESNYWPLIPWCPRDRYTFEREETVEGNVTRIRIIPVLKDDTAGCRRCWEYEPSSDTPTSMEPQ